jgi:hypothetical protein
VDKALQYVELMGTVCRGCGTREAEWYDEHKREVWPPPYVADAAACPGCEALEELAEDVKKKKRRGVRWFLRRWREGDDELLERRAEADETDEAEPEWERRARQRGL